MPNESAPGFIKYDLLTELPYLTPFELFKASRHEDYAFDSLAKLAMIGMCHLKINQAISASRMDIASEFTLVLHGIADDAQQLLDSNRRIQA